jgi:hypothetical protein
MGLPRPPGSPIVRLRVMDELSRSAGPPRTAGPEHMLELQQVAVMLTEVALAKCVREGQPEIADLLRQALRRSGRVLHLLAAQRNAMTCCHGADSESGECEHAAPWSC